MYGGRAGYPIVHFGGRKRGVEPNCMENKALSDAEWHCELKG
jgi:hypothetical protein